MNESLFPQTYQTPHNREAANIALSLLPHQTIPSIPVPIPDKSTGTASMQRKSIVLGSVKIQVNKGDILSVQHTKEGVEPFGQDVELSRNPSFQEQYTAVRAETSKRTKKQIGVMEKINQRNPEIQYQRPGVPREV